jgi:O-antigen polymerase
MKIKLSLPGIIISLILVTSLFHSKAFTDPFIMPKYFFLTITGCIAILFFLIRIYRAKYKLSYAVKAIDISLLAFVLISTISYIAQGLNPFLEVKLLSLYVLFIFYLLAKTFLKRDQGDKEENKVYHTVILLILLIGVIQPLYGLAQYAGIFTNHIPEFRLGGAYGNPGPYSNVLVAILPFSLIYAFYSEKGPKKYLAIVSVLLILITLPLTKARTAWIAGVIVVGYTVLHSKPIIGIWNKYFFNWLRKMALFILIGGLIIVGALALTSIKQDSASGRKFIYKVTLQMFKDKPLAGHGFASYPAVHNNYQADYFKNNPDDWDNAFLADGINYAFNEYLHIASETGLIGLLAFLLVIFFSFKNKQLEYKKHSLLLIAAEGSLIAILVSSLFSYPLQDYGVLSFFFISLTIISSHTPESVYTLTTNKAKRRLVLFFSLIVLLLFVRLSANRIKAEKDWKNAFEMVRKGQYDQAKMKYEELYPVMEYNQFFIFNYGAELTVMQEYQQSVNVLKEVEHRLNDSDFYIYLGSSQEGIGILNEALQSFEKASNIMPVKFYPRYRMVLLYQKLGEMDKAKSLAQQILDMPIKVDSDVVSGVRQEMKVFLNSYNE